MPLPSVGLLAEKPLSTRLQSHSRGVSVLLWVTRPVQEHPPHSCSLESLPEGVGTVRPERCKNTVTAPYNHAVLLPLGTTEASQGPPVS